jgi:uncharacterized phage protein (TIGR01671 family)
MREIIFRGKRVDNGEWIEGFYEQTYTYDTNKQLHRILWNDEQTKTAFCADIIPETLGQFTGGYGRNTTNYAYTKLWENDIVKIFSDADGYFNGEKRYIYGVITYDEDSLDWKINLDHIRYGREEFLCNFTDNIEVVGNRFDNAELLTAERSDNENQ